jgi:hypothetical protein
MPYFHLLLSFVLCALSLIARGQDSLFEFIILESTEDTVAISRPLVDRDFYRSKSLFRLRFQSAANKHLRYAKPKGDAFEGQSGPSTQEGVINLLLEGLQMGDITAYFPDTDRKKPYSYDQLRKDLMILEGMDTLQGRNMGIDELGGEWLSEYLDLLVDEGIKTDGGDPFVRIRYFRLIWWNPNTSRGMHALALFSYPEVQPLLEKMEMYMPQHGGFRMNVSKFFDQAMYQCWRVDRVKDSLRVLDAPPLSKRVQPDDVFRK